MKKVDWVYLGLGLILTAVWVAVIGDILMPQRFFEGKLIGWIVSLIP